MATAPSETVARRIRARGADAAAGRGHAGRGASAGDGRGGRRRPRLADPDGDRHELPGRRRRARRWPRTRTCASSPRTACCRARSRAWHGSNARSSTTPPACSTAPRRSAASRPGGSESILMGVKSARDRARRLHPEIDRPHMVVPESAHPAFTKGADYFGLRRDPRPARSRLPDRPRHVSRGGDGRHRAAGRVGPQPDSRHGRPDRGAGADRRRARHRVPRRLVRRRLLPAVRREARRAASRASTSACRA